MRKAIRHQGTASFVVDLAQFNKLRQIREFYPGVEQQILTLPPGLAAKVAQFVRAAPFLLRVKVVYTRFLLARTRI